MQLRGIVAEVLANQRNPDAFLGASLATPPRATKKLRARISDAQKRWGFYCKEFSSGRHHSPETRKVKGHPGKAASEELP